MTGDRWNNGSMSAVTLHGMPSQKIRTYGDPVLNTRATDVTDIDGRLAKLCDDMFLTMYEAPGIGLAAPQIGVQKRVFVYDHGDGAGLVINPEIVESDGETMMDEGCLSVPGLSWEIVRPKTVHLVGYDLDGNELSIEADELQARLFQHELDHLDGILLIERLDADTRKAALGAVRELDLRSVPAPEAGGLRLL